MKMKLLGHQGDVCIFEVDEFPTGTKIENKQTEDKVIAYGELSGHCHAFAEPENVELKMLEEYPGMCLIEPLKETNLEHGRIKGWVGDEVDTWYHKPVTFKPGKKYITGIVEETDWITRQMRRVID